MVLEHMIANFYTLDYLQLSLSISLVIQVYKLYTFLSCPLLCIYITLLIMLNITMTIVVIAIINIIFLSSFAASTLSYLSILLFIYRIYIELIPLVRHIHMLSFYNRILIDLTRVVRHILSSTDHRR